MERLNLSSIENARKTLARAIRGNFRGDINERDYRNLIYGLSHLLAYFKAEADLKLEAEIEEIKRILADRGQ